MEPEVQGAPAQNQTPAPQGNPSQPPAADNTLIMGVLAYIGILVIIPFLVAKQDPFVNFHVKQGIVLVVLELAMWVLGMTIWILAPFIMIINLGALVLSIIGIVNVVQKKEVELPIVGQFAKHVNI